MASVQTPQIRMVLLALLVVIACRPAASGRELFQRADANGDARINVTDAVQILRFLFLGQSDRIQCEDAGDADDDGRLTLTDAVVVLRFLFLGGPAPPPPFERCAEDPSEDALSCASFAPCEPRAGEAPVLADLGGEGEYSPYFATAEMNRPRYFFAGVTGAQSGLVYVVGGSDERGLSALDSLEVFDQGALDPEQPAPESVTGRWIDTDFEGNPIVLKGGPRIFHSVNELPDGRLVVLGGSSDILSGSIHGKGEVFDPVCRTFEETETTMAVPTFRHRTVVTTSGDLLVVGGQFETTITIGIDVIDEQGGGHHKVLTVFPSTPRLEVFNAAQGAFRQLRSTLGTPRGRADHDIARIAGPDGRLGTNDDVYVLAGGYQTLSAESGLAPRGKLPGVIGRAEADSLRSIEVFDAAAELVTRVTSVRLVSPRINGAQVVQLGEFNDFTPDGVAGMGNAFLVTHGNDDAVCPTTPLVDQVFIARFIPGGGPAGGLALFEVADPEFSSRTQNGEYVEPPGPLRGVQVGRAGVNAVAMPRRIATAAGEEVLATWVFSLGGADSFPSPGGCAFNLESAAMLSGCVFDPFFSLRAALLRGLSPRDLAAERRAEPANHLGIVGVWFTLDGLISGDRSSWSTTPDETQWAASKGRRRVFGFNFRIPGADGVMGTADDRILLAGGGRDYAELGGEPTIPSAEVFLPPRTE